MWLADLAGVLLAQANSIRLPLSNESVHYVAFSPPYWALRRYSGEAQVVVWPGPGMTNAMPGGAVEIPGNAECQHEWA